MEKHKRFANAIQEALREEIADEAVKAFAKAWDQWIKQFSCDMTVRAERRAKETEKRIEEVEREMKMAINAERHDREVEMYGLTMLLRLFMGLTALLSLAILVLCWGAK